MRLQAAYGEKLRAAEEAKAQGVNSEVTQRMSRLQELRVKLHGTVASDL